MSVDAKIEWVFCNSCRQKTKHFVRASHAATKYDDQRITSLTERLCIVECCGCENLAFTERTHFSEYTDLQTDPVTGQVSEVPIWEEAIYPPVMYRSPPTWFEDLPDITLRQISNEIYKSLQTESLYLATFGSRTLIDRLMVLTVGDQRTFDKGLRALVDQGKMSQQERDTLEPVLQAGHAAAHRGWSPTQDQLKTILDTVEGLIHRLLVLPKLSEELEEVVPGRYNPSKGSAANQVTVDAKIANAPSVVRGMYEEIEAQLKSLGDDVLIRKQKHYVAFRRNRNFASVQVYNQKRQIRAYINVDPDETDLLRAGVRDVRQVGHYGTGDLEVTITSKEEVSSFADLFELSYGNS